MVQDTRLYFTEPAMDRMMAYIRLAPEEISGFGLGDLVNGNIVVDSVFILPQESGAAHTEMDPDGLQDLLALMLKEEKDPSRLCLWWHSHVDMGVSPSGTDTGTIEYFGHFGREWMVALIGNKRGQLWAQLDSYSPFRMSKGLEVRRLRDEDLYKSVQAEITELVKRPLPEPSASVRRWTGLPGLDDWPIGVGRGAGFDYTRKRGEENLTQEQAHELLLLEASKGDGPKITVIDGDSVDGHPFQEAPAERPAKPGLLGLLDLWFSNP